MTEVGISIIPYWDSLERNRELVRVADEGGLALVGIQDHPYQRHFFDTWSLIPTLMAATTRVSFFTDVASLPLRPPAVMAKAAASLDVLSGGRFELGLGGGALPELIANFGGPKRTPGATVEAVDEAIDVLRLLWSRERSVSFDGKHYQRRRTEPAQPIATATLPRGDVSSQPTSTSGLLCRLGVTRARSAQTSMRTIGKPTSSRHLMTGRVTGNFPGDLPRATRSGVLDSIRPRRGCWSGTLGAPSGRAGPAPAHQEDAAAIKRRHLRRSRRRTRAPLGRTNPMLLPHLR
jgi:hypothetical protein